MSRIAAISTRLRLISALVFGPLLMSCGDSLCFAEIIIEDPILTIREARNASTGAPIPDVVLTNIHIQGQLQRGNDLEFVLGADSRNAILGGDQLHCTLECAFGADDDNGEWRFTVSAPGYTTKTLTIPDVRYDFERDGCTHTARGTVISLTLDPAP